MRCWASAVSVRLPEDLLVALGVEAHDKDVSSMESGCPQGAASTQHDLGQLVICGAVAQLELEELLPLGDPDLAGLPSLGDGLVPMDLDLVGDDEVGLRDTSGSQELLGSGAAGSGLAVVVPLDVGGHGDSFLGDAPIRLVAPTPAAGR